MDEADARRAREHSSDAPINDGDAWRVEARSEEGKKGGGHTLPAASVGLWASALVFWSRKSFGVGSLLE